MFDLGSFSFVFYNNTKTNPMPTKLPIPAIILDDDALSLLVGSAGVGFDTGSSPKSAVVGVEVKTGALVGGLNGADVGAGVGDVVCAEVAGAVVALLLSSVPIRVEFGVGINVKVK